VREADKVVPFGEWLPDMPSLNNPGLTEAKNVVPADGVYKPYLGANGSPGALVGRPYGAISVFDSSGSGFLYAGTLNKIYVRAGNAFTSKFAGTYTTAAAGYWQFVQFDEFVIGTNYANRPQSLVVASGSDFANLATTGTAPFARCLGVIGRFVVLGDTNLAAVTPNGLQWCAIDDPQNWPTPGSGAAQSVQAGEQFLNLAYGPVTAIAGGQEFGIIFQRQGITRMSYVGGNVVFQFDVIEKNRGALFPNAVVQIGRLTYFASGDGFYVTDGVDVKPIGDKKVDNYFADSVDTNYKERVYGAVDYANKCIYWTYTSRTAGGIGVPDSVLIYNYVEGRWSRATDSSWVTVTGFTAAITLDEMDTYFASLDLVTPSLDSDVWKGGNNTILGFDVAYRLSTFSTSAFPALIDGGEVEIVPGRLVRMQGVKPLVIGTAPTLTVSLGTRDSLGASVTYTTARTPNSRTGFADFRAEARYHRVRLTIDGNFESALGVEYQAVESAVA